MHVFLEILEICLTFQYEESTMAILSLVPRFEPSVLRGHEKEKNVFSTANFLSVWMSFYWSITKEICQLSEKNPNLS